MIARLNLNVAWLLAVVLIAGMSTATTPLLAQDDEPAPAPSPPPAAAQPADAEADADDAPADDGEADHADERSNDGDANSDNPEDHPGVAGLKKVLSRVMFEDFRLREFAMALADKYEFNVVIYADIPSDPLSLNLRNVPVGLALSAAAQAVGCSVAIDRGIAFVWPKRVVKPNMTERVYRIPANAGASEDLGAQISELAGSGAIVLVGPNGCVLFVVATQESQDSIARYLLAIRDRSPE